jgi:uncharacterized protein YbjT (DUF2867 family)
MIQRHVFITGATGYLGRHLIPVLAARGHRVRALVRPASAGRLDPAAEPVAGDALDSRTFRDAIAPADTLVHLVGVSHPNPLKASQFRKIDLVSLAASLEAAMEAGIRHFVFVSVAQPAPVMQEYVRVRAECEDLLRRSGLNATVLRPFYVLGPGHRWAHLFAPVFWLFERLPPTAEASRRLGLVTIDHMVGALVHAVEHPASGVSLVEVPRIRRFAPDGQLVPA